ncbi:hypothetical protein [Streptomyces sp. NPDC088757]|uniref:hypothetical protein n=1 Tax=Streptomyces sp. NPDC088757 TaxID=3365889 RepID=UPI00380C1FAF
MRAAGQAGEGQRYTLTSDEDDDDFWGSAHGTGLVDLTVTLWCGEALPGAERVRDPIRTGRLNRTGM